MSAAQADVVATAFPDITSLTAADEKALTQCKGVTDALARAIRLELAPGELEDERRSAGVGEEPQAFVEEGNYDAALEGYDRLLRARPEETSVWFDRAETLVLLDRAEEALQCYARVLDVDRGNARATYERANLLFGLGRLSVAVDALRDALRLEPSKSGGVVRAATNRSVCRGGPGACRIGSARRSGGRPRQGDRSRGRPSDRPCRIRGGRSDDGAGRGGRRARGTHHGSSVAREGVRGDGRRSRAPRIVRAVRFPVVR